MSTLDRNLQTALAHLQDGQVAEAVRLLEQAAAEHPQSTSALHMLGVALAQQAQWARALDCLHRAVALDRDSASSKPISAMCWRSPAAGRKPLQPSIVPSPAIPVTSAITATERMC